MDLIRNFTLHLKLDDAASPDGIASRLGPRVSITANFMTPCFALGRGCLQQGALSALQLTHFLSELEYISIIRSVSTFSTRRLEWL